MHTNVFDQFAPYTNVQVLAEYSAKPLRKCIRVNTLLLTVEQFKAYATIQAWQLEPVPWCSEGFFIERAEQSEALGRDILHQLGYFYIQEASSMLPPVVLDPQPGELILDMSAAPGSKTTQLAAMMEGRGLIIANDIQPKRLKTLQAACYRLGATNTVLTQKNGQWFGQHMAERFDRVLCDAPCSALGTVRKDPDAISLSTDTTVTTLAHIQQELLDSACKAVKKDGIVVYSTCTLTVEENEAIVESVLQSYPDTFELVAPEQEWAAAAIQESNIVQQATVQSGPMLRLWPHTYNTEGFFSAVLRKKRTLTPKEPTKPVARRERTISKGKVLEFTADITKRFGTSFIRYNESLSEWEGVVYLVTTYGQTLNIPNRNYSLGVPYGKLLNNNTIRISNDIARLRGAEAVHNVVCITKEELQTMLDGKNVTCTPTLQGDVIVQYEGYSLGTCTAQKGILKNTLDRELVRQNQ
jgi:16S rRNA (cytosine1407-C5)-methyltransferase